MRGTLQRRVYMNFHRPNELLISNVIIYHYFPVGQSKSPIPFPKLCGDKRKTICSSTSRSSPSTKIVGGRPTQSTGIWKWQVRRFLNHA